MDKKKRKDNPILRWLYQRIRRFVPGIVALVLLCSVSSVNGILMALLSRNILNNYQDRHRVILFGAALLALVLTDILINGLISVIRVRVNGQLTIDLRTYLFSTIVRKKYPKISDHHTGDLLNRFTSDVEVVTSAVAVGLPNAVALVVRIGAGVAAMFLLNWKLGTVIFVAGVFFPAVGRTISRRYRYMHQEVQRTEGQARSFMQESFANIVVIKSFRSEKLILRKLNEYMDTNLKVVIRRNYITVVLQILLGCFFYLGYNGILVWGAAQLQSQRLLFGDLTAFLQLIWQLIGPLQDVSGILPQYYAALASAERLKELENIEDESAQSDPETLRVLRQNFEKISVKNLAFAYDTELVLKNCTFDIPRGEITALTGGSGCGKSTLFKIMLGLYEPTGGSITINDDVPVSPATRELFSYVPQGNMILSGTLRENITMCNEKIREEDIIRAAKAAAIYDFIETLPDGLDTEVKERGAGLSEGQVQRISIARALLSDAPILLLDEATSALDEATETKVLTNIRAMAGKTVLFITHRNTSLSICDHIVHAENHRFTVVK